jgi:hypothetical protein
LPPSRKGFGSALMLTSVLALSALSACEGCKSGGSVATPNGNGGPAQEIKERPTLRLYLVSNLAGALEPCGCVKDQLGGFDHFAALVDKGRGAADSTAVLTAGPTFFMEPALDPDKRAQDITRAEALAAALKQVGFFALAPGKNDYAAGDAELEKLVTLTGGTSLFANRSTPPSPVTSRVLEVKGMKVGVIGVAGLVADFSVPGVATDAAEAAVKIEAKKLAASGADVIVLLASMKRGEVKRIADAVPELGIMVVGAPEQRGEANTKAASPESVNDVLVVETANHLQTVTVVDFWKRAEPGKFVDGTGAAEARRREDLRRRIQELREKVADWERGGKIAAADLQARKADVAKLEEELLAVKDPPPPDKKSFYRVTSADIRTDLGVDPKTKDVLSTYYKKVNEDNKVAFAGRKPRPVTAGEPSYVGIDTCEGCHEEPVDVWKKTRHATAYKTLSDDFKEFNLDCVSCHVTGYEKPGGSTVTAVAALKNVQCEVCHGPGSAHVKSSGKTHMPVDKPAASLCETCHHPPHVHEFDAAAKMDSILGPGHGRPKK